LVRPRSKSANPLRKLFGLEHSSDEKAAYGDPVFIGRTQIGIVTSAMRSTVAEEAPGASAY
jgi:aminomethyltransferase